MEKEEFFDMNELKRIFHEEELFISLDIYDPISKCNTNIIENKSVNLSNFPNNMESIGKKYWCEKKIKKYLDEKVKYEYTLSIKLEKKGVFQMSETFSHL